ncbi:hypothetical protein JZ751_026341, partial [Albula glossodonta]
ASEVKLGIALVLNVTVTVENRGENSYNTHVLFTYPEGLSYRRVTVVQKPTSRATVQCNVLDSKDGTSMGKSVCYVNKPIFKSSGRVVNYIRDLDASVIFRVPIKLGDKNIWSNVSSIQIPHCLTKPDENPHVTDFVEKLKKNPIVDCTISVCRVMQCDMALKKDYQYSYNISGEVSSAWIEQAGFFKSQYQNMMKSTGEADGATGAEDGAE